MATQTIDWEKKKLGALWKRTKTGSEEKFLSGTINLKNYGLDKDIDLIIFTNKKKVEGDRLPDFQVYFSEPFVKGAKPAASAPAQKAAPKKVESAAPQQDDDVIF